MFRADELNALGLRLQDWIDETMGPDEEPELIPTVIVSCSENAAVIEVGDIVIWHSESDPYELDLKYLKKAWIHYCQSLLVFASQDCGCDETSCDEEP